MAASCIEPLRRIRTMANRFQLNLDHDVSVFVPPDAVYPGLPANENALLDLLAGLSRDDTLLISARINAMVTGFSTRSDAERQQQACRWICSQHHLRRLDDFAREHGGVERVVVFFRGQLLEMMRQAALHCRNLPGDGETFSDERIRDRFFRAVLIAGTLWSNRIYGDRLSLADGIDAARRRSLGAFRKGIEDASQAIHSGIALGRSWLLFSDYLPRELPDFAERFAVATGLTLEQYLVCVGALTAYTVTNMTTNGPAFRTAYFGAATAFDTVFPVYLALESMTPEDLARAAPVLPATGFRALRERPILSTSCGLSAVLDPAIYGETLTIGPLFHLIAADKGRANELFGHFGRAFERYAIDILRRIYPLGSGLLVQRLLTNVEGRDAAGGGFEIDAALNDVTEIVLFEMKAAWLREDSLLDASGEEFVWQLRRKYGMLPAEGAVVERPKGAAQLAKIAGAIARREWVGASGEFAKAVKIYPVLVVYDERLGIPGCGKFLDDEFKSLLQPMPQGIAVAPLTIMSIGDLENLETSTVNFAVRDLLKDYTRECPDRMRSVHQFMATSSYADRLKPSQRVRDASEELMHRIQRNLFPQGLTGSLAGPDE
jgi:hypothetical protein